MKRKKEAGLCHFCGRTWSDHPNISQACKETCEAEQRLAAAEARATEAERTVTWYRDLAAELRMSPQTEQEYEATMQRLAGVRDALEFWKVEHPIRVLELIEAALAAGGEKT